MGSELPEIPLADFERRLEASAPDVSRETWPRGLAETLFQHYLELRRWNPRLSLVGPGTAAEVVERHYGESLAAVRALDPPDRGLAGGPQTGSRAQVVDIGSGAGFPGLVLAAARPDLAVTLVESRQRKWTFLLAAIQRCGLSCRCLNARVGAALPDQLPHPIDALVMRGVRLPEAALPPLVERLSEAGRWLVWAGSGAVEVPGLYEASAIPLAGENRRIAVLERRRGRSGAASRGGRP
jgi:16S rRNA (guanine527-N7)-methyltransferase